MTVTLLIGEPCVGKSRIARAILGRGEWEFRSVKYVAHHAGRVLLLGVYEDGQQFPGTDRLSMACQPHAVAFCKAADRPVVIEGDRLGNGSFIAAVANLLLHNEVTVLTNDTPADIGFNAVWAAGL
jgi:hypothetical protein